MLAVQVADRAFPHFRRKRFASEAEMDGVLYDLKQIARVADVQERERERGRGGEGRREKEGEGGRKGARKGAREGWMDGGRERRTCRRRSSRTPQHGVYFVAVTIRVSASKLMLET